MKTNYLMHFTIGLLLICGCSNPSGDKDSKGEKPTEAIPVDSMKTNNDSLIMNDSVSVDTSKKP